jgi:toxin ParE1/3/4
MEPYRVIVSSKFHQDMTSILSYMIHDLKEPAVAARFLESVEKTVQSLSMMPERFELVKDEVLREAGYRKCPIKNYLLFYKIFESEKSVRIYRIIYGRRNWKFLL